MSDAGLPKFVVIRAGKLSFTSISEKECSFTSPLFKLLLFLLLFSLFFLPYFLSFELSK
jgi:hypothetical protein